MVRQTVLVTGANGFVGRAMVARLVANGNQVHAATRGSESPAQASKEVFNFPGLDLGGNTDWSAALQGVSTVIHCAARVHVMRDAATDPLREFRRVNVDGSARLAEQAASAGAKRLIFVSSIGVLGGETTSIAFRADDIPVPHTPYAQSKLEAELAIRRISALTGLEVTIIRPPMVYGRHAPGNFSSLLNAIERGFPLPLASVDNSRSFVAIGNLVDLLLRCCDHPAAAGETFLVSDAEDISTTELLRRIAKVLGRRAHLFPVPVGLLRGVARLVGKSASAQSLLASLQLDIAKTRNMLDWSPVIGMNEALARALQPISKTKST